MFGIAREKNHSKFVFDLFGSAVFKNEHLWKSFHDKKNSRKMDFFSINPPFSSKGSIKFQRNLNFQQVFLSLYIHQHTSRQTVWRSCRAKNLFLSDFTSWWEPSRSIEHVYYFRWRYTLSNKIWFSKFSTIHSSFAWDTKVKRKKEEWEKNIRMLWLPKKVTFQD